MGVESSRTHSSLRSKYDRQRKAKQVKFVIGLLVFVFLVVVWNSSLPSQTLPGARRGDFRPEVARGVHHGHAGTRPRSSLPDRADDSVSGTNGAHDGGAGGTTSASRRMSARPVAA